jgi:hypothetical protein
MDQPKQEDLETWDENAKLTYYTIDSHQLSAHFQFSDPYPWLQNAPINPHTVSHLGHGAGYNVGVPPPKPVEPFQGHLPAILIRPNLLPSAPGVNGQAKFAIAPMDNMNGQLYHFLHEIGCKVIHVTKESFDKSPKLSVRIGDVHSFKEVFNAMKSNKFDDMWSTYHQSSGAKNMGGQAMFGVPSPPNAMDTVVSAYLAKKQNLLPQPSSLVGFGPHMTGLAQHKSPMLTALNGSMQAGAKPSSLQQVVWDELDAAKKAEKLQKKTLYPGAPASSAGQAGSSSSGSALKAVKVELPLDDRSRELVQLMEDYQKREIMGDPL